MNLNLTVTPAASEYIQKMLAKEPGKTFRLSVKKTGCSGYSYLPALVESIQSTDQVIELENGVKVYVDTAWLDLLQGVQMDYVEEGKTGLKQKRLVFNNPNESSRCGCGESFHIE